MSKYIQPGPFPLRSLAFKLRINVFDGKWRLWQTAHHSGPLGSIYPDETACGQCRSWTSPPLCQAGDMSSPAPRMLVEKLMQYLGIAHSGLSVLPFSCHSDCHVFNSWQHMQLWRLEPNLGKLTVKEAII